MSELKSTVSIEPTAHPTVILSDVAAVGNDNLGPSEYVRVIKPSFLEVYDAREYPMHVMRAIAQAANECGLEGKIVTGIAFDNKGPEVDVILEVRPETRATNLRADNPRGFGVFPLTRERPAPE